MWVFKRSARSRKAWINIAVRLHIMAWRLWFPWKLATKSLLELAFLFKRIASVRKFIKTCDEIWTSSNRSQVNASPRKPMQVGDQTRHKSTQVKTCDNLRSRLIRPLGLLWTLSFAYHIIWNISTWMEDCVFCIHPIDVAKIIACSHNNIELSKQSWRICTCTFGASCS